MGEEFYFLVYIAFFAVNIFAFFKVKKGYSPSYDGCLIYIPIFYFGFIGAIIGLIVNLCQRAKLKEEQKLEDEKNQRMYEENRRIEEKRLADEKLAKKNEQARLTEKYYYSSETQRIIEIIKQGNKLPYKILFKSDRITISYENGMNEFVFRAHQLPDMDKDNSEVFAKVINQKLGNIYDFSEESRYHVIDNSIGGWTEHIGFKLELKIIKSF